MKKLILILFVLCSAFATNAQVRFGIKAGLNLVKPCNIRYDLCRRRFFQLKN